MTVVELIEMLEKYNENDIVMCLDNNGEWHEVYCVDTYLGDNGFCYIVS